MTDMPTDPAEKMSQIRNDFSSRSESYEDDIVRIVPNYRRMLDVAVSSLPFGRDETLNIVDLGTGTGSLAVRVKGRFRDCHLLCVDMTESMLAIAKERLGGEKDVEFLQKDFYDLIIPPGQDAVVASLSLHHLITDDDKRCFYRKVCKSLRPGGVFVNADAFLSSDDEIEALYMDQWREFMLANMSEEEVGKIFDRHAREDSLKALSDELGWLSEAGFSKVDVIWKDHMSAVCWARK